MNLKIAAVAILLILIIGGAFYISLQKDTEVLIVNVTLAVPPDNDSSKVISDVKVSLVYVRKMEVPEETPLERPGITVLVIQNMQEKSAWYSVPIPVDKSIYGSYTITVKLYDKLDRTKPVRILTRVVDPLGRDMSVRAVDIKLE